LYVAVIVTLVTDETEPVVMLKLADAAPAKIVTFAGTVAADVLLDERVTVAPPGGAAPFNVTEA